MKTKRKLNVRLLRRIQRYIMAEPRRFFMGWWVAQADTQFGWKNYFSKGPQFRDLSESMPPCGTAACIAGTANLLTGAREIGSPYRAQKMLGLTTNQSAHLFSVSGWPTEFGLDYREAKTPKRRAKIACARIDHLIETGE